MNLGTYQDLQEIGRGGMGVVYKARDWEGRTVAIKRIQGLASSSQAARLAFVREAGMTAQLRHKNIITVFDVGQQAGVLFIVMEYLQGQSLSQLMKKRGKALGFSERLAIVKQTCEALQYAHERSIIHRDIKPGNIFICRDSTVKVIDFGIAALFEGPSGLSSRCVGTPYYMSPEQILGSNLGPASDIWSVGVTLFELLRGKLPFVAGTSEAVFQEILSAQIPVTPTSLPFARDLDQVFSYALAKQPEKRYSSAREMAADLERLMPVVARCESEALANVAEGQFDFNELTLDTLADPSSRISVQISVDPNKGSPGEKSPAQNSRGSEVAARKAQENYSPPVLGFRVTPSKNVSLLKMSRLPKTVQLLLRRWLPVAIAAALATPLFFAYQSHVWPPQFIFLSMTSLLAFIWVALLALAIEKSALWLRSAPWCPGCRLPMRRCSEWARYPNSPQENAILERDCREALRVGAWEEATKLFTILGRTYQSNARFRYQLTFYQCEACEEYAAKLAIYELRPNTRDQEFWDQRSDATIARMCAEKSQREQVLGLKNRAGHILRRSALKSRLVLPLVILLLSAFGYVGYAHRYSLAAKIWHWEHGYSTPVGNYEVPVPEHWLIMNQTTDQNLNGLALADTSPKRFPHDDKLHKDTAIMIFSPRNVETGVMDSYVSLTRQRLANEGVKSIEEKVLKFGDEAVTCIGGLELSALARDKPNHPEIDVLSLYCMSERGLMIKFFGEASNSDSFYAFVSNIKRQR